MNVFPTECHAQAYDRLVTMGSLYFSAARPFSAGLALRLQPLLVGPTGSGKSHLVEQVANALGRPCRKLTFGEWMVLGGRGNRPSIYQLVDELHQHDLILLIDELDKLVGTNGGSDWTVSVKSDLWNVLDKRIQIEDYLLNTTYPRGSTPPSVDQLRKRVENGLWICGAGTFQNLHEAAFSGKFFGFGTPPRVHEVDGEIIAQSGVPAELLSRFNGDLVCIRYPNTTETQRLLAATGVEAFASELGISVTPEQVDWRHGGGMRALQTIATRLVLEAHRRLKSTGLTRPPDTDTERLPTPKPRPVSPNLSG